MRDPAAFKVRALKGIRIAAISGTQVDRDDELGFGWVFCDHGFMCANDGSATHCVYYPEGRGLKTPFAFLYRDIHPVLEDMNGDDRLIFRGLFSNKALFATERRGQRDSDIEVTAITDRFFEWMVTMHEISGFLTPTTDRMAAVSRKRLLSVVEGFDGADKIRLALDESPQGPVSVFTLDRKGNYQRKAMVMPVVPECDGEDTLIVDIRSGGCTFSRVDREDYCRFSVIEKLKPDEVLRFKHLLERHPGPVWFRGPLGTICNVEKIDGLAPVIPRDTINDTVVSLCWTKVWGLDEADPAGGDARKYSIYDIESGEVAEDFKEGGKPGNGKDGERPAGTITALRGGGNGRGGTGRAGRTGGRTPDPSSLLPLKVESGALRGDGPGNGKNVSGPGKKKAAGDPGNGKGGNGKNRMSFGDILSDTWRNFRKDLKTGFGRTEQGENNEK